MDNVKNYLQMLIDGLNKKKRVLEDIQKLVQHQAVLLDDDKVDQIAFDNSMARKSDLISELNKLNDGFENVYDRVRDELLINKDMYKEDIKKLQELISAVSEKSILIETMEERNMKKAEDFFKLRHREIKSVKQSNAVANSYFQNMSGQAYVSSFDTTSKIDAKK